MFSLTQTEIERRAAAIRNVYRKRAYQREVRYGRSTPRIQTAASVADFLPAGAGIEGSEAIAAAKEVQLSGDPVSAFANLLPSLDDATVNYLYAMLDYEYFAKKYLPDFFTRSFSPMYHDEYFKILRKVETHATTKPSAVAGPREWGKSAIGCWMMPLHIIIFPVWVYYPNGRDVDLSKKYIGFISVAEQAAQRHLETVCVQLEDNERIRNDFGEFYRDPDRKKVRQDKWSARIAHTLNGKRMEIFGRKGKIRGAAWRGYRLDLALGDDLEDDENAESQRRQDRDYKWITQTVANCVPKENGNVLLLGNLVNLNGIMDRIIKHGMEKDWNVKVFRLYEEDPDTGEKIYLWEDEFGPEYEKGKREISEEGFDAEFLQNPEADAVELKSSHFVHYEMEDIRDRIKSMATFSAIDPAASTKQRADYTAIVNIAYDIDDDIIYVLPSLRDRVPIGQQPSAVVSAYCAWRPLIFGVETANYQASLEQGIREHARRQGVHITMKTISHQGGNIRKAPRITYRLNERIKSGRIRFLKGDKVHEILKKELIYIHSTRNDDVADALEMAVDCRDTYYAKRRTGRVRARIVTRQNIHAASA